MNDPQPFSPDELEPAIGADERAALVDLASRLIHERPAPRAGFRAQARDRIGELGASRPHRPRPAWLLQRVALLAFSGAGLLGVVGLGLAGLGPFAP